jgi:hypothetical protein
MFLSITNKGEMQQEAMTLLGASTKRGDDTKIGFFGSGLKYAMAVLIREDIKFHIYSGKSEVKITTQPVNFRGKEFQRICVNGEPTSMTTDMGVDWEPWFALREVLCNAIDEGSHTIDMVEKVKGAKGVTTFAVEMSSSLNNVMEFWQKYFCEKRPDVVLAVNASQVFHGDDKELIVYRRGVRCHHERTKALFHYNMQWAEINESRVLSSQWSFNRSLVQWLAKHANEEIARRIVDNFYGTYEATLDWDCDDMTFSNEWLAIIGNRALVAQEVTGYFMEDIAEGALVLPHSLVKGLKNYFKDKVRVLGRSDKYGNRIVVDMDERKKTMLTDVLGFLKKSGIDCTYPVHLAKFKNSYTHGEADKDEGQIYIAEATFDNGKRYLALTLMEEMMHLKSGAGDGSRSFQNYIISELLKRYEAEAGVFL